MLFKKLTRGNFKTFSHRWIICNNDRRRFSGTQRKHDNPHQTFLREEKSSLQEGKCIVWGNALQKRDVQVEETKSNSLHLNRPEHARSEYEKMKQRLDRESVLEDPDWYRQKMSLPSTYGKNINICEENCWIDSFLGLGD
ncbi:hypothetical protein BOTNAR_0536g00080 [Botryotinia narcissicola]|uniref:Uncharacterized protein n=1 Tax=Botryotinia narcissicola TaxID=278944 RepID=A0A4Z1HDF4_9HELO|nr:hypothetical protein BOTNAR_0536g00080 [Botryotinia narcissicola]